MKMGGLFVRSWSWLCHSQTISHLHHHECLLRRNLLPLFNKAGAGAGRRRRGLSSGGSGTTTSIDGETEVLIVGAGPVGLVLAMMLTKLGVGCAVLEKNKKFSTHPQAHFINNRSMELFRRFDCLADEILRLQSPVDLWRKFIYCTSVSGTIIGTVDHVQPQDFDRVISPTFVAHFSQYKLMRLLLKRLENLNFNVQDAEVVESQVGREWWSKILMGCECRSIKSIDEGIVVSVAINDSEGRNTTKTVKCSILIGADGAGSTIRKLAGVDMEGERDMQQLVSVHFFSQALGKYLLHHRAGMLFFIFNQDAIGVLVAHDLNEGEFVLQIPYYPPQQNFEDFTLKRCKETIFKLVGYTLEDLDLVDIKPWVMHAEVAEKFVTIDKRVILAGDAAHRFPPAGGFGMNTGIQDAHNLAWKIASVIKGIAPFPLLETYETERKPIAKFNTALSVENFKDAMLIPSALGLNPSIANSVHKALNSSIMSILPSPAQKVLLEGIFSIGRAQLSPKILNEFNPLGSSRLTELKKILEDGKSLQLQFPAEDLGFRYIEGAIVPEPNDVVQGTKLNEKQRRKEYIPTADIGVRLPHMTVRIFGAPDGEVLSTLDLVRGDKLEFLLIIGPERASYELVCGAYEASKSIRLPLRVCIILPEGCKQQNVYGRRESLLKHIENVVEVEELRRKSPGSVVPSLSWWDICGLKSESAILVRPDDHIAWRAMRTSSIENPVLEMERVFHQILKLETP